LLLHTRFSDFCQQSSYLLLLSMSSLPLHRKGNKKAVLLQGEPHDATVNLDTCHILQ